MKRITVLLLLILTVFFSLYSIENSNVGFRRDEFNPALPDMHDIGILSSLDPVAFVRLPSTWLMKLRMDLLL